MKAGYGNFFKLASAFVGFCSLALASHPDLNGTWVLNNTRSNFAGEPVIATGNITINDREHHMYISRNFNFDNEQGGFEYSFTTDGQVNSWIKKGTSFKSKAKWEGDTLKVTTTRAGLTTVEHYSLSLEGNLILNVERPNHRSETLIFQHQ